MRALRFDGATVVLDRHRAVPDPGPREALVRPIRTGISCTDRLIAAGSLPFDGVMGREFVGVVESFGDDVGVARRERLSGARVVASANVCCGACELCRGGLSAHCRERTVIGCLGRDGCFADAIVLPVQNLFPVPDGIDDDAAVFAEPLAAAVHAAQLVHVESRPYVTVLGDGTAGLLCAQVLARLNASVRVLGREPRRFGLCEKWGIKHRHADEAGLRRDQDVVVDCTGSTQGIGHALGLVRPRGTIVVRSSPGPLRAEGWDASLDLSKLVDGEIEVVGARCGSMADALPLLARHEIDVLSLITKRAKLEDGAEAVRAAGDPQQIRVVMDV